LLVQADRRLSVGLFLEGLGAPLSTRFRLDGVGPAAATWPASVRLRIEIAVGRR
jgi:hypothetical protein